MSSAEHTIPDANRLYIGEGVTIKGEISVPDTLVVCGSVEGDVSVGNLIVGETGSIKGRITVTENAEISGKVFEKLDVKCLLILRVERARRRQCQLRTVADRAGREHCRRPVFHRLSAGTEVPKAESLQPARSATGQAGNARRQATLTALEPLPTPVAPPAE